MASSSLTSVINDGEYRNWAALPTELTSSILIRLCAVDILENAQNVCTTWRHVCKDLSMWRKIVMHRLGYKHVKMCRHAVDRSQGGFVEIDIWHFANDSLLNYIADSSSNLIRLLMCFSITTDGLTEALVKRRLLEELEVSHCSLSAESLKVVGQSCPNLKTLKLKRLRLRRPFPFVNDDDDALAIAETMPRLRHIQLFANKLTDAGLNAILDHCPNLEHLDVRKCRNVNLSGVLEKRCSERIKVLRRPHDKTHDHYYPAL